MIDAGSKVERDERTIAVENAGYRWAYTAITYALLIDVMVRSLVRGEAPWDLLALVLAGGAITTAYQLRHRTVSSASARRGFLVAGLAAVVAAVLGGIFAVRYGV